MHSNAASVHTTMQLRATNTTMQVHAASIGNARHHEQRPKAAVNGEGDSGTRDGGGGVKMKATAAVAAQRDGEGGRWRPRSWCQQAGEDCRRAELRAMVAEGAERSCRCRCCCCCCCCCCCSADGRSLRPLSPCAREERFRVTNLVSRSASLAY